MLSYGAGRILEEKRWRRDRYLGAVLLTVGRSYIGHDFTHSTLLDRACACSYKNFLNIVPTALVTRPPGTLVDIIFLWREIVRRF